MATMVAKMPSQVAPMAALALGVGGCAVAGYVCGQHGHPAGAAERQPPQREPEPEQERPKMTLAEPEAWLRGVGVLWVDGRAPPAERRSCDVADLAVELAAFSAEVAREANGQGGVVDRKPHKQRMSADFGGPMHDGGANTRLGGRHTQAMLAGDGPGARGLRRRWELLDAAVSEICAEARLIQMFAVVGTGQGQGATTGEPHADAQRDRETGQPIGARGTIHLTASDLASREFRVAEITLQKKASGDSSAKISSRSLQPTSGADGRRHLPEETSVSRRYANCDVSILNAEGLGVVRGKDGTQTGHEGGIAPLGGVSKDCTMHGGIVFSLDKSPTTTEMAALAMRVAADAAATGPGLRYSDPERWETIRADNGDALIAGIEPRRRRPLVVKSPDGAGFGAGVPTELVGMAVGYNAAGYAGKGRFFDTDWPVDCEARESYGARSVEGQVFRALDAVRLKSTAEGVSEAAAGSLHALAGRTPVYSRAARTDRGVDALCNVLSVPLESALLGDGSAGDVSQFLSDLNAALPGDVRVFQVFRTAKGFNAKQFCEYRQYEMLVPLAALQQVPSEQKQGVSSQQRCVWRTVCPELGSAEAGSDSGWERHERWLRTGSGAALGLLAAPALPTPLSLADGSRWAFEWTQSRRRRGTAPPMIRLAVCVTTDGDSQQEAGQWYVSAVGEGRCHTRGAALEYFGCAALTAERQRELRTLDLSAMLWRPVEMQTLHILKAPNKPAALPGKCRVVRFGFWCDGNEVPSEDAASAEACTVGSTLHKPSKQQLLTGAELAAARTATLESLLTPAEVASVQALTARTEEAEGACVTLDLEGGRGNLTKQQRTALYDAIGGLDPGLRCTLLDPPEGGVSMRMIKIWMDTAVEPEPELEEGSGGCGSSVLNWVEFGVMRLVELLVDGETPQGSPQLVVGGAASDDEAGAVATAAASDTAAALELLLQVFEGKQGHSFHNFSGASLTASQRKCKRQLSCAACSSFLLQQEGPNGNEKWGVWAVLTFTSPGFLFQQIQHMAGCVLAVACGAVPLAHLENALRAGSGSGVGGGGGGEILRVPSAPSGTLTLVSCCYMRKLPRKDTKPIWVGPRAAGGKGGFRLGVVGVDTTALLDWQSGLHRAQTARWEGNGNGTSGSTGSAGSGRSTVEWCEELRAAAQEMWAEAATQEALANRKLGAVREGSGGEVYEEVLRLLRAIESEGMWPATSLARTSLYAGATGAARRGFKPEKKQAAALEPNLAVAEGGGDGEAEVAAEAAVARRQTFCMGAMPVDREPPAANRVALLRELMVALADLEQQLPERPPSSTVAVNKHVTYRPHKDGGAGAGQGVSLIIGMGDYSGGELVIEGKVQDVRYRPLEFNGWTQRHWTLPFEGERFSVVWFTPRGCEGRSLRDEAAAAAASSAE